MSTFSNPVVHHVVNEASQLILKFYDGANNVVANFATPNHRVDLYPIFDRVRRNQIVKREKTNPSPGTAQVSTLQIGSGLVAGDNIRVRVGFNTTDQTGADLVNVNNDSYYTVDYYAKTNKTAAQVAADLNNLFNQTTGYPFTVSVAGTTLTFTALSAFDRFGVYVTGSPITTTYTVVTSPVTPVGTYKAILPYFNNIQQHGNLQSIPEFELLNRPQPNVNYVTYYWEIDRESETGGHGVSGEITKRRFKYRLYVKDTLTTLISNLDLIIP